MLFSTWCLCAVAKQSQGFVIMFSQCTFKCSTCKGPSFQWKNKYIYIKWKMNEPKPSHVYCYKWQRRYVYMKNQTRFFVSSLLEHNGYYPCWRSVQIFVFHIKYWILHASEVHYFLCWVLIMSISVIYRILYTLH